MSIYREVRVRPVVRYIVTYYELEDEGPSQGSSSTAYGVFESVKHANIVGDAIAGRENVRSEGCGFPPVVFEPARKLRIDWLRGPGEPQEAIRWVLSEVEEPPLSDDDLRDA